MRYFLPLVEARQLKTNIPSWDEETSLRLLPRILAARPSGLVEVRGIEPLSENRSARLSPGAEPDHISPVSSSGTNWKQGSHFVHDRFNGEPPMHVHHSNDA